MKEVKFYFSTFGARSTGVCFVVLHPFMLHITCYKYHIDIIRIQLIPGLFKKLKPSVGESVELKTQHHVYNAVTEEEKK